LRRGKKKEKKEKRDVETSKFEILQGPLFQSVQRWKDRGKGRKEKKGDHCLTFSKEKKGGRGMPHILKELTMLLFLSIHPKSGERVKEERGKRGKEKKERCHQIEPFNRYYNMTTGRGLIEKRGGEKGGKEKPELVETAEGIVTYRIRAQVHRLTNRGWGGKEGRGGSKKRTPFIFFYRISSIGTT